MFWIETKTGAKKNTEAFQMPRQYLPTSD